LTTSKRKSAPASSSRSDSDANVERDIPSAEVRPASPDESRREDILAATLRFAAQEGFDKISVRKVAALAGVSPSLITYHYKTKTKLIAEAWWLLHEHESRRRDETVGRVSALKRIEEGFRILFEGEYAEVTPQFRLDFWAKTARTPALLDLYLKHEKQLRDSHLAGIRASVEEGDLDSSLARDVALVEDLLQAFQLGLHTWSGLHTRPEDRKQALRIGRLFLSLLRSRTG
jgi:AcrR family transcriptional regulator